MKTRRAFSGQQPALPGVFNAGTSRRLPTPHEQALAVAKSRLILAIGFFALAYITIGARLAYLTLLGEPPETPTLHAQASDAVTQRADITDRNGVVLATSLPTMSLCADGRKILDAEVATKQLLTVLPDLDAQKLREDLGSAKRCVTVKRHLTPKQYYEVNRLGIAGLEFQPDERRTYPLGALTAHTIGYTDIDNNGLAGIEKQLDTQLDQRETSLTTTLDMRVQNIMRTELTAAMNEFRAIGAAGLVMDSRNGEIISLVSLPDFDPQHPGKASDDTKFNRDTLGVYEMGSTFKIFNTAMALDSGNVHLADSFDTAHPIEIGRFKIKDFHPEDRWMNVAEIFTHSSNIGSAHMVRKMGATRQRAFFAKLGLMNKMPFDMPEVGAPLLPSAKDWSEATMLTAAFGHGIAVNAVQLAGAVATIVNDGITVHPTLIKRNANTTNDKAERVISPKTSAQIRALMRMVVTRGTAKNADAPGYIIGGKTGTADKLGAGHRYNTNARLSSFIGAFPLNDPRYIIFALLDEPKPTAKTHGFATGGWTAAPVVSRVVSQIGPLLDVAPLSPELQVEAERQLLKPLGSVLIDGSPTNETPVTAATTPRAIPTTDDTDD